MALVEQTVGSAHPTQLFFYSLTYPIVSLFGAIMESLSLKHDWHIDVRNTQIEQFEHGLKG
ncbi:MAG: hypothetical protein ACC650_06230 [Gammaproteobacteria bacterium]